MKDRRRYVQHMSGALMGVGLHGSLSPAGRTPHGTASDVCRNIRTS